MNKRVLVTGGLGFIGNRLVPEILDHEKETEVIILDKNAPDDGATFDRLKVYNVDITDERAMEEMTKKLGSRGFDRCVHLAAVAAPRMADKDPKLAWDTNVRGTFNVLTMLKKLGSLKIVFLSSAHVYGISPRYMPTDENHPLALFDTYTTTKLAGEQLCDLFHKNYGLLPITLRLFNAYGPGQSPDYFLGVKLKQAMDKKPITLMNRYVTKDWVWVDDVVKAIRLAMESDFVGPINIGTGVETSLLEIGAMISNTTGLALEIQEQEKEEKTRMCCNYGRAIDILDWQPTVGVKEGISRLLRLAI